MESGGEYVAQSNGDNEYLLQFVPIYGLTDRLELSVSYRTSSWKPVEAGISAGWRTHHWG